MLQSGAPVSCKAIDANARGSEGCFIRESERLLPRDLGLTGKRSMVKLLLGIKPGLDVPLLPCLTGNAPAWVTLTLAAFTPAAQLVTEAGLLPASAKAAVAAAVACGCCAAELLW